MWKDLTMSQKAEVMKMASANGIYDLNSIRSLYDSVNTYATGGDTEAPIGANIGNIIGVNKNTSHTTTNLWDYITSFGKTPVGVRKYDSEVPFKNAFRDARNAGDRMFIYKDNKYNTDIKPDEYVAEVRNTSPTTLRGIAQRKLQIREPNIYRNLSEKEKQKALDNHSYVKVIPNTQNYKEVNSAVKALQNEGLTKSQIISMLGNSMTESGWRNIHQINGPAQGYYQMENQEYTKYKKWLEDNNLKDDFTNSSVYIARLFKNKDKSLKTPHSRAVEYGGTTNIDYKKYKTAGLDEYKGVTTEDAFNLWNNDNIDDNTKAFMQLYERAGKPHLDRRQFISHIIAEDPNIEWGNMKAKGGTLFSPEVVITPDYEYNQFLNTLPDNQRLTPENEYSTYRYWRLNDKPKSFEEAIAKDMYSFDKDDNLWHGSSVAFNSSTGEYEFMKPDSHDTYQKEIDWYNSPAGKNFRKDFMLTKDKNRKGYSKYIRRK